MGKCKEKEQKDSSPILLVCNGRIVRCPISELSVINPLRGNCYLTRC